MRMRRKITILLADDHLMFLRSLAALLAADPRIKIVATCASGTEALEAIRLHAPDFAILDIGMPGLSGLDIARVAASDRLTSRIIILTASATDKQRDEAREAGVSALIFKDSAPDQLIHLIVTLAHACFPQLCEEEARRPHAFPVLTPREREITFLLCGGFSNKEIARQLSLSEATVKTHLHNAFAKTGTASRTALAMLILRIDQDNEGTDARNNSDNPPPSLN